VGVSASKCFVSTLLVAVVGLAGGCGQSERRRGAHVPDAVGGGSGAASSFPGGESGNAPVPSGGLGGENAGQAGDVEAGGVGGAGTAGAVVGRGGFGGAGTAGSSSGFGGAGTAGWSGGGAGTSGSVGGAGAAGTGGTSVVSSLPTCLTDLFAACWPEGACQEDTARNAVCYDSGVRVVTTPLAGGCANSTTLTYYAADGSVCFVHSSGRYMGQACENFFDAYYDGANTVIATASGGQVSCVTTPTVPCDLTTDHCSWPTDTCLPGACPD